MTTAIAARPVDYTRIPESGRPWSPAALRRRQAITHVDDRHDGLDVDQAQLDELRRHLPRWPGRDQMLEIIDQLVDHPVVDQARGRRLGRDGLRAIWRNDVLDAAQAGGLLRTSRRHAAIRAGYKDGEKAVQKARQIGRRVGLYVELYRGRELSQIERLTLWHDHDRHRQRGLTSVYAVGVHAPRHQALFTTPRPGQFAQLHSVDSAQTVDATPLPRSGSLLDLPHVLRSLSSVAAVAAGKPKTSTRCRARRTPRAGLGLAIELLTDQVLGQIFAGVRPGRIAGQLKRYEAAGWAPAALAAALRREASTLRVSPWEPARSPFGLLKTLLRGVGVIPDVDAALYGAPPSARPAYRPEPCGGAACDGHGWVNAAGVDGSLRVSPCPDCPPALRANHAPAETAVYDDDLPF